MRLDIRKRSPPKYFINFKNLKQVDQMSGEIAWDGGYSGVHFVSLYV